MFVLIFHAEFVAVLNVENRVVLLKSAKECSYVGHATWRFNRCLSV